MPDCRCRRRAAADNRSSPRPTAGTPAFTTAATADTAWVTDTHSSAGTASVGTAWGWGTGGWGTAASGTAASDIEGSDTVATGWDTVDTVPRTRTTAGIRTPR